VSSAEIGDPSIGFSGAGGADNVPRPSFPRVPVDHLTPEISDADGCHGRRPAEPFPRVADRFISVSLTQQLRLARHSSGAQRFPRIPDRATLHIPPLANRPHARRKTSLSSVGPGSSGFPADPPALACGQATSRASPPG
jgi:hypothetical protein